MEIYTHILIHMYIHTYIHTYIYIYTYYTKNRLVFIYIYIYIYIYRCTGIELLQVRRALYLFIVGGSTSGYIRVGSQVRCIQFQVYF